MFMAAGGDDGDHGGRPGKARVIFHDGIMIRSEV